MSAGIDVREMIMDRALSASRFQADNKKLRRRAEDRLMKELAINNASQLHEVGRHLYDLRIDQIEIELLSDEFNRLRHRVAEKSCKHQQTAPRNSYYFLDRNGRICDAKLLRSSTSNSRNLSRYIFSDFVTLDQRELFQKFLHEVFASNEIKTCELTFEQVGRRKRPALKLPLYALLKAVVDDAGQLCLVVVEDISVQKLAEHKKELAELQRHKRVIDAAMEGFWLTDAQGNIEQVNEAYAQISGYTVQELVGMNISQLEACERPEDVRAHIEKLMAQGYERFETQHLRKDGSVIDIEIAATFLPETQEIFVFSHDISQRKQAEMELRLAAATFETQDAILITDAQSNIIRVNRSFTEITGYSAAEVLGKNPRIMSSGLQDREFYATMWRNLLEQGSWSGEIWDKRKDGDVYPKWLTITAIKNERGETTHYVAIFNDISERKQAEAEIRNMAFYDPLTGLPNRRLLNDRLNQVKSAGKRYGCYSAIVFLDLDNFKSLNDTHGHGVGDMLLVEAAGRLTSCMREMDTVARLGGDEFVVMLNELDADKHASIKQARIIAEKIRATMSAPYRLTFRDMENAEVTIEHCCTTSIGVVVFINHEESNEDILKWADAAMYRAKESGRNQICFFGAEDSALALDTADAVG
jgi:diguanylate cyclase (GGDEF)-like protein/PAS domain S-box-containing protein